MASTAMVKARAAASMKRVQQEALKRRHTMAVGTFAAGVGYFEKSGRTLPQIVPGVPAKIQLAVIAALVADNSSGETKAYAQALCDGMVAIAGYNFGRGQEIGASDDEVDV